MHLAILKKLAHSHWLLLLLLSSVVHVDECSEPVQICESLNWYILNGHVTGFHLMHTKIALSCIVSKLKTRTYIIPACHSYACIHVLCQEMSMS